MKCRLYHCYLSIMWLPSRSGWHRPFRNHPLPGSQILGPDRCIHEGKISNLPPPLPWSRWILGALGSHWRERRVQTGHTLTYKLSSYNLMRRGDYGIFMALVVRYMYKVGLAWWWSNSNNWVCLRTVESASESQWRSAATQLHALLIKTSLQWTSFLMSSATIKKELIKIHFLPLMKVIPKQESSFSTLK